MKNVQKCCSGCLQSLPIEEFRRRKRGSEARESRCNRCHKSYMKTYRKRLRERALLGFAHEAKWRADPDYLTAICRHLVRVFGGADKFAEAFVTHFEKLSCSPGEQRQSAGDFLLAVLRLMDIAERAGQTVRPVAALRRGHS